MEIYFVISNSEGDTTVRTRTKTQLLNDLDNGDYGENPSFIEEIPQADTNYWGDESYLIIKGEIITPTVKQVVTKHDL